MENFFAIKLDNQALHNMSTLALAHIGDAVFELLSRTRLAKNGVLTSKNMHKETISFVCATAQANSARVIFDHLTDDEHAIFKRGRNSSPKTVPKSTTREDYALATALEALFGYLFLRQEMERINELYDLIVKNY